MVELASVATIERTVVDPSALDPQTPYLGLEHIERGGTITGRSTVAESELKSAKFAFTTEHVLYGKLRPYLGKVARPNFEGICSTDILPVKPGSSLDRGFLIHYLRQPGMVAFASSRSSGANLPRLSPNELGKIRLPLPPISEQRRIAAILDQADAVRAKRRQVLAHLDALPQATFRNMFGSPPHWGGSWSIDSIGSMAASIQYGTSGRAGAEGDWPVLRMGNLTDDGRLALADLKYMNLSDEEIPKFTVRRGDMLFNRTNSADKVGKTSVVHTDQPFAYAGYLVRVRFDEPGTADYVATYLASDHGRAVRRRLAKAAVNQANINAKEMAAIRIAVPPSSLRANFAERLESIRQHRARVASALARDDELFASLQARAFRGEL